MIRWVVVIVVGYNSQWPIVDKLPMENQTQCVEVARKINRERAARTKATCMFEREDSIIL